MEEGDEDVTKRLEKMYTTWREKKRSTVYIPDFSTNHDGYIQGKVDEGKRENFARDVVKAFDEGSEGQSINRRRKLRSGRVGEVEP